MAVNRKSSTASKFTGKSWGIKFLTKAEKNESKIKSPKISTAKLNRIRFELLINKLDLKPDEKTILSLYEKFNLLQFEDKKSIRKSVKSRKTKLTLEELIVLFDKRID